VERAFDPCHCRACQPTGWPELPAKRTRRTCASVLASGATKPWFSSCVGRIDAGNAAVGSDDQSTYSTGVEANRLFFIQSTASLYHFTAWPLSPIRQ
jgi:hypothetical protein